MRLILVGCLTVGVLGGSSLRGRDAVLLAEQRDQIAQLDARVRAQHAIIVAQRETLDDAAHALTDAKATLLACRAALGGGR